VAYQPHQPERHSLPLKQEAPVGFFRHWKSYEVQLLLTVGGGSEPLGRVPVPLDGFREAEFEKALKKAGITQTED